MKTKTRLATDKEQSMSLKVQGYKPETCSGKCVVHSRSFGAPWFLINKISHKCGYSK